MRTTDMPDKLRKPYPTFPLTPHPSGRGWSKKYKGVQLFIRDREPEKAVERFNRLAGRIDKGEHMALGKSVADPSVFDVCNRYVHERKLDREAGRLSAGAWNDYDDAAAEMYDCFGEDTLVEDLAPDDFTRLHRRLVARLGPHAMGRMIQSCRTIFKHAFDNNWIRHLPRFGSVFKKPTTEKRQGKGFTLEETRVLVACAVGSQLEAMLLLMLNGGYTAKDCAALPRSAVDVKLGIIKFPRPKMKRRRAIDRVMTLWPETAEALAEVMADRPDDELVFRTAHGNPWVRGLTDSVRLICGRIQGDLGWAPVRGPSWLRHLHRTISDELEKPHAAARLMGHRLPGLAEVYVDTIEHIRIQQVTDHIRARLWPCAAVRRRAARS